MDAVDVMRIVALAAATALSAAAVWALRETVITMRSLRRTSDELRERALPLLDKAEVTVDAVNVELLRIDSIITTVETASERVSSASGALSGIVSAPGEILSDVVGRARRAWKDRHREQSGG